LPLLLETTRWLQSTLDHAVPGMVVKAGLFPDDLELAAKMRGN
jgi:hypothetical protein